MNPTFLFLSSLSAAIAVALGAFGAHGLRARLGAERLATFETGVRYQFYHVIGLALAAVVLGARPGLGLAVAAGWLFVAGTVLFSFSLYLLAITERRWLGAITPFGGLAFIAGWLCLALAALSL